MWKKVFTECLNDWRNLNDAQSFEESKPSRLSSLNQRSEVSIQNVVGPSLIRQTCISAPNWPVSTWVPKLSSFATKYSYSFLPSTGFAARENLGRFPRYVSAASVNWLTTRTLPVISWRERFMFSYSSAKTLRLWFWPQAFQVRAHHRRPFRIPGAKVSDQFAPRLRRRLW